MSRSFGRLTETLPLPQSLKLLLSNMSPQSQWPQRLASKYAFRLSLGVCRVMPLATLFVSKSQSEFTASRKPETSPHRARICFKVNGLPRDKFLGNRQRLAEGNSRTRHASIG
jgi:hypothetical protein